MRHATPAHDGASPVRTIVAQLEAASTLLKFAADDLENLAERTDGGLREGLFQMSAQLLRQASSLFENALFLDRIEVEDEPHDLHTPAERFDGLRHKLGS